MKKVSNSNLPFVSIITPCRNEKKFIGRCIESIINSNYPKEKFEHLVMDGMSEDSTRKILKKYSDKYTFIRFLNNPNKVTPYALNIGVKHAKGDVIIWVSAHATCERDYILQCVKYLYKYGADRVGGRWKILPQKNTPMGKAIAHVLSHPFGVGNAYYRFDLKKPKFVDAVPFFCCKKNLFSKVGLFNEKLARGQDMEFSLRIKKAGLKTLLVPTIVSYYYARSNFLSYMKHNFKNGIWAILPFKYAKIPISTRHLIPLLFVLILLILGIASLFSHISFLLFILIALLYLVVNLYFSTAIALKEKKIAYIFILPIAFAGLHFAYGMGSIWGTIKLSKK